MPRKRELWMSNETLSCRASRASRSPQLLMYSSSSSAVCFLPNQMPHGKSPSHPFGFGPDQELILGWGGQTDHQPCFLRAVGKNHCPFASTSQSSDPPLLKHRLTQSLASPQPERLSGARTHPPVSVP